MRMLLAICNNCILRTIRHPRNLTLQIGYTILPTDMPTTMALQVAVLHLQHCLHLGCPRFPSAETHPLSVKLSMQ